MPVILIILDNSTRILCRYVVLVSQAALRVGRHPLGPGTRRNAAFGGLCWSWLWRRISSPMCWEAAYCDLSKMLVEISFLAMGMNMSPLSFQIFSGFLCWLPGNKLQFFSQRCFSSTTPTQKLTWLLIGFWASQVALAQFALRHSWAGSQCRIGRASDTAGIGASHSWIQTWAFSCCRASNDVDDTS